MGLRDAGIPQAAAHLLQGRACMMASVYLAHHVASMVDQATPGPLGSMLGLPRIMVNGATWDIVSYRYDETTGRYSFCCTGAGAWSNPWTEPVDSSHPMLVSVDQ
jgi:hypothetical protein